MTRTDVGQVSNNSAHNSGQGVKESPPQFTSQQPQAHKVNKVNKERLQRGDAMDSAIWGLTGSLMGQVTFQKGGRSATSIPAKAWGESGLCAGDSGGQLCLGRVGRPRSMGRLPLPGAVPKVVHLRKLERPNEVGKEADPMGDS